MSIKLLNLPYFKPTAYHQQWKTSIEVFTYQEFNEYIKLAKQITCKDKTTLHYTSQGHFEHLYKSYWGWGIRDLKSNSSIELQIVLGDKMWRIVFLPGRREDDVLGGTMALKQFRKYVKGTEFERLYGVTSDDEVMKIKEHIPSPIIDITQVVQDELPLRVAYEHADHFDINSAYAAEVVKTFPEIAPFFYELYAHRHENPENKEVLCKVIGASQSLKIPGMRFPKLAQVAIKGLNATLSMLTLKLEKAGYEILAWNTDGVWARRPTPDFIYHDADEGVKLGQWKRDHSDVTIRFKSKGCYEWIEDGEYHTAARGIKKELLTYWGSIFDHNEKVYLFDEEKMEVREVNEPKKTTRT